jgi:hypothetical protein
MDINRELAELLGLCWHEYEEKSFEEWNIMVCQKCGVETNGLEAQFSQYWNPDFTSDSGKIELLRLMMKREDWPEFLHFVWFKSVYYYNPTSILKAYSNLMTDTTGLLAQAARDFLKGQNKFKQIETEEAQSIR